MIDLTSYTSLTTMIVLATKDEQGNPYVSNMYFKVGRENNFYFRSKFFRQHSKHVVQRSEVTWSIINTEKYEKDAKDKKALQFQGTCIRLSWKEAEEISKTIYEKDTSFEEIEKSGQYIFRCIPKRVKIWDEVLYGLDGKIIEF